MNSSDILLIGPVAPPSWGPAVRNRIMIDTLESFGLKLVVCNTLEWKKNPLGFLFQVFFRALRTPHIFLSVSSNGRFVLLGLFGVIKFFRPLKIALFPAGGLFADELYRLPSLIRKIYLFFLRGCDLIASQTKGLLRQLEILGLENVAWFPNFKPFPSMAEESAKSTPKVRSGCESIVYFSRIKPKKGVETLIEALDILEKRGRVFRLDIYGILTEDYRPRFLRILEERPWARFYGKLDISEVLSTLSGYSLMVFPTQWEDEGFPGVLVDAAMAGLPVIASRIAYNDEIIRDGFNGLLVESGDSNDLAEKINFLLEDRKKLRQLGENNRKISKDYDAERVLERVMAKLRSLGWEVSFS